MLNTRSAIQKKHPKLLNWKLKPCDGEDVDQSHNPQLGQASSLRALRAALNKKNNRLNGKLESSCDEENNRKQETTREEDLAAKGDVIYNNFIARKWDELKRMKRGYTSDEIVIQIHAAIKKMYNDRLNGKFESSSDDDDDDLAANEDPFARKCEELAMMNTDDNLDEIGKQIRAARREAMQLTTIIRSGLNRRGRKKIIEVPTYRITW